jgi:hypothetical protein
MQKRAGVGLGISSSHHSLDAGLLRVIFAHEKLLHGLSDLFVWHQGVGGDLLVATLAGALKLEVDELKH